MITYEPIMLDVDVSQEEYDLDVDSGTALDMDVGTSINVTRLAEGSLPTGGVTGDIIVKNTSEDFDCSWVAPANEVEENNTLPITAAAVYTTVGNINALLATI